MSKDIFIALKKLAERLQKPGFSWQHMDFYELQAGLPKLLSMVSDGKIDTPAAELWICDDCRRLEGEPGHCRICMREREGKNKVVI